MSIDRKVEFLSQQAFPGEVTKVIETHMSWVFLTGRRVHKLKKPVRLDLLDYSSVEARRRDCEAEVRLNQELAPEVYLGVVPLVLGAAGLQIGGEGSVQDWLVVMRRLPAGQMLDSRLRTGPVSAAELRRLARTLVDFHERSEPVPMAPDDYRRRLARGLEVHRQILTRSELGLSAVDIEAGIDVLAGWIGRSTALGDRASRLIDGHGDLRAEHVVLAPEILIIDRLSFNADLRIVDPLHELALLVVECERLGASQAAATLLDQYCRIATDPCPPALTSFYTAEKAMLRARLSIAHALDPGVELLHWQRVAERYLDIAGAQLDVLRSQF